MTYRKRYANLLFLIKRQTFKKEDRDNFLIFFNYCEHFAEFQQGYVDLYATEHM